MIDNWNPHFYDEKHSYVSQYGEDLIQWLNLKKGQYICDVGCGTGDLTNQISKYDANVIGIDSSPEMIKKAKTKYPDIDFEIQGVENMLFKNQFDSVFSNATLHWIKETEKSITSIWNALKYGGHFIAEFGGKKNIEKIVEGIDKALDKFGYSENKNKNPWVFLSVGEYTSLLEKQGFIVRNVHYYDRPTKLDHGAHGLRNWLEMFAFFFFENIKHETLEKIFPYIEDELRPELFKDGVWFADYKRLRIKAEKPQKPEKR